MGATQIDGNKRYIARDKEVIVLQKALVFFVLYMLNNSYLAALEVVSFFTSNFSPKYFLVKRYI